MHFALVTQSCLWCVATLDMGHDGRTLRSVLPYFDSCHVIQSRYRHHSPAVRSSIAVTRPFCNNELTQRHGKMLFRAPYPEATSHCPSHYLSPTHDASHQVIFLCPSYVRPNQRSDCGTPSLFNMHVPISPYEATLRYHWRFPRSVKMGEPALGELDVPAPVMDRQ